MSRLHKLLDLSHSEQQLLSTALCWVLVVRLALWILPFRTVHYALRRVVGSNQGKSGLTDPATVERALWAVRLASRYVPSATCLTQALAAYLLLLQHGQLTSLYLGVSKSASGCFEAHAWIELDGKVLIGRIDNFRDYVPMRLMNGESS